MGVEEALDTTTVTTVIEEPILPLVFALGVAWIALLVGLVILLRRRHLEPPGTETTKILILLIVFVAVSGFLGYGAVQIYVNQSTWNYNYDVGIIANGTGPEYVILPVPQDTSLLASLHLIAGTANWSFVDTPKGRGLYIAFSDDAVFEARVSQFPPPSPLPDTSPTMQDAANASGGLRLWVYYPNGPGIHLDLSFPSWYVQATLVPGWTSLTMWPILPPVA